MSVFNDYARYYNLLYADKAYAAESAFVLDCLRQGDRPVPETLLDLGCGTGQHALEMARQGIAVTGVDLSEVMLAMGRETLADQGHVPFALPVLQQGDARTVRLAAGDGVQCFDAVTSLFHVMSYQTTDEDALALLVTAREHVRTGGRVLFDFWYAPGVLSDPPVVREKIFEDAHTHLVRHARPVVRPDAHVVEVHYTMTLTDKASGRLTTIEEVHNMRYWFLPELHALARRAGLTVRAEGAWMAHTAPQDDTWNAWMLCEALPCA